MGRDSRLTLFQLENRLDRVPAAEDPGSSYASGIRVKKLLSLLALRRWLVVGADARIPGQVLAFPGNDRKAKVSGCPPMACKSPSFVWAEAHVWRYISLCLVPPGLVEPLRKIWSCKVGVSIRSIPGSPQRLVDLARLIKEHVDKQTTCQDAHDHALRVKNDAHPQGFVLHRPAGGGRSPRNPVRLRAPPQGGLDTATAVSNPSPE